MKYIAYWKFDVKDWEKATELSSQFSEQRKKEPNKYTRPISDNYYTGYGECFRLVEADTEEQLINSEVFFMPFAVFRFVPIVDTAKTTAAIRERMKK